MSDKTTVETAVETLSSNTPSVPEDEIRDRIETMLEYGVPIEEAQHSVASNLGIEANSDTVDLADFGDEDWGTVEVKVVELFDSDSEAVAQVGIIGDESGTRKFTIWATSDVRQDLEEGQSYRLNNVVGDEYQGQIGLKVNSDSSVEDLDRDVSVDDEDTTVSGIVTAVKPNSGLIKRCPVEDCTRVLQNGRCPEHGEVEGEFDQRLKLAVDTGGQSVEVIADADLTEELTGISLDEAQEIAMDALDTDAVLEEMEPEVVGRFVTAEGVNYGELVFASEIEIVDDPDAIDDAFAAPSTFDIRSFREEAYLLTPTELNLTEHLFQEEPDEDRSANYGLTPTGEAVNRVAVVGTLTETEDVGNDSEFWQGRIVGPTGEAMFVYAGQYQPEAMERLRALEPPEYVAVVGKPRTYENDDGSINVSLRPENIQVVAEGTRDVFWSTAAAQTQARLNALGGSSEPEHAEMARDVYGDGHETMVSNVEQAVESLQDDPDFPTLSPTQ